MTITPADPKRKNDMLDLLDAIARNGAGTLGPEPSTLKKLAVFATLTVAIFAASILVVWLRLGMTWR